MAKPEAVFIYIGTYPDEMAAQADYDVVKDLHAVGAVGSYDAAVVTKDDSGKVHGRRPGAGRAGRRGAAAASRPTAPTPASSKPPCTTSAMSRSMSTTSAP